MDANTPLWKAHDISQQLQDKIEVLPNVGRAFVHVDHETTHIPVSAMILHPPLSLILMTGASKTCLIDLLSHLIMITLTKYDSRLTYGTLC